jgi:hypothetical protein
MPEEKQTVPANFTGALVGELIEQGLRQAAANKNNDFTQKDVAKVTAVVKKEVVPVVVNATNKELWYQSRVIVGTAVSLIAIGARFAGVQMDVMDQNTITDLVLQLASVIGGAYALYGRMKAGLKPIGE